MVFVVVVVVDFVFLADVNVKYALDMQNSKCAIFINNDILTTHIERATKKII